MTLFILVDLKAIRRSFVLCVYVGLLLELVKASIYKIPNDFFLFLRPKMIESICLRGSLHPLIVHIFVGNGLGAMTLDGMSFRNSADN